MRHSIESRAASQENLGLLQRPRPALLLTVSPDFCLDWPAFCATAESKGPGPAVAPAQGRFPSVPNARTIIARSLGAVAPRSVPSNARCVLLLCVFKLFREDTGSGTTRTISRSPDLHQAGVYEAIFSCTWSATHRRVRRDKSGSRVSLVATP